MNGLLRAIVAMAVLLASATTVSSETVSGLARLVDGDTLEIRGQKVRLSGIDAPETGQKCRSQGRSYPCGQFASDMLSALIGKRMVTCHGDERDQYNRLIADCSAGGLDLNREMVRRGWAVAFRKYTEKYLDEELEAAKANRGLWRGPFRRPTEYRAAQWAAAEVASPNGCPIKGNISDRGRIYHTPWSRHYSRTRINTRRGERWFCSEAEAIRAGWRAPLR